MNLKDKSVLVYDHGLFVCLAQRLAEFFGTVFYYVPWSEASIGFEKLQIGEGLPGLTRVVNVWDIMDQVDLFIFPDVNDGDLAEYLRHQGKRVWGSGGGEELELFRFEARELFKKLGLPQLPARQVQGTTALAAELSKVQDKWIKLSRLRHVMETWHHEKWSLSEPKVQQLTHCLGPLSETLEFIVEDSLPDAIELGVDSYVVDGQWPGTVLMGLEVKDVGLVGKVIAHDQLPKPLRLVNEALAPVLKDYNYRGFFSTEVRIDREGTPYLIDPCCRMASPPGELYIELWKNLGEILWHGAGGRLIDPEPLALYGAECMIYSDWSDKNWTGVDIEAAHSRFVKLCFSTVIEGRSFIIPQDIHWRKVGAVIGVGDSMDQAIKDCQRHAQGVEGFELEIPASKFTEAEEALAQCKEFGVEF